MDQVVNAQEDGALLAPPWTLLGRDNPAGKALFKLYNAVEMNGRATGLQLSQHNRLKIQKQLSRKPVESETGPVVQQAVKKAKPKVAVPHFRSKAGDVESDRLAQVPHRRQGQQILAEMAREQEQAWGHAPQPAGRLLGEEEKHRCALLMQHKGKVPAAELLALTSSSSRNSRPTAFNARGLKSGSAGVSNGGSSESGVDSISLRRRVLQQRFTETADEVAEREEFIASMQQLGKLQTEHLNVIRAEVAAKVREMGQLDGQIRELDKQLSVQGGST